MSSIQLNKALLVFSSLIAEINKNNYNSLWSKKCFSHQNEPHRAKQSISGVLKHFCGNVQNTSLLSKKKISLQNEPHIAKLSSSGVLKHF